MINLKLQIKLKSCKLLMIPFFINSIVKNFFTFLMSHTLIIAVKERYARLTINLRVYNKTYALFGNHTEGIT